MEHITQDGKKHSQETTEDVCPYCLCSDSRFHRFWQCEHFEWARRDLPESFLHEVCHLPEAMTCYGWDLMPSTLFEWCSFFTAIPMPVQLPQMEVGHSIHLFTDGSCFRQSQQHLRFASWAVILASPDVHSMQHSHVLESGILPG